MGVAWSKALFAVQQLPDRAYAVQGQDTDTVNTRRLLRFIKEGFLAPVWSREGPEDLENDYECPICFHSFPSVNCSLCCNQNICTECFLKLVKPTPGSRYGSPCPFCTKPGFHAYYSPGTLSRRRMKDKEEKARITEAQLRTLLASQAAEEAAAGAASTLAPVILRSSPNQKPEWEEWPEEELAAEESDQGFRLVEEEEGLPSDRSDVPTTVDVPEFDGTANLESEGVSLPGSSLSAERGPGTLHHRSNLGPTSIPHKSALAKGSSLLESKLRRRSVGWHQLTGHGSSASLTLGESLPHIHSGVSIARSGSIPCSEATPPFEEEKELSSVGVPDSTDVGENEPMDDPIVVEASSAFQPRRGGPVVLTGPDGARLLYLLACDELSAEEKQALKATADEVLGSQGLGTYNAPTSAFDDRLREAIARADALVQRRIEEQGRAQENNSWLERMAAADAALQRAVDSTDRAVFGST